jgi:hypothetical protein
MASKAATVKSKEKKHSQENEANEADDERVVTLNDAYREESNND